MYPLFCFVFLRGVSMILVVAFAVVLFSSCWKKKKKGFWKISLPFAARGESSRVQPHPPRSATSEQPTVRGNRDDASPQSSHPRVCKNGSEHFRWAESGLSLYLSQRLGGGRLPQNLEQILIKKQMLHPINVHLVWQIIGDLLFWPSTLP